MAAREEEAERAAVRAAEEEVATAREEETGLAVSPRQSRSLLRR